MSEIEIGEYVRTEEGEIHKVIKIIEDDGDWDYYCCENNAGYFAMDIAKHSKQLIDLIEEGDYVNGELITDKWDTRVSSIRSNFSEEDIKTILTKENYMANCYKVGGEENKCM